GRGGGCGAQSPPWPSFSPRKAGGRGGGVPPPAATLRVVSASGPGGRRQQPPRSVACVAKLPFQRPDARGRDGFPPAPDEADRPVEGLDGSTEAPEHERATGRASGRGEQVADPLPAATDRGRKHPIPARRGKRAPARAGRAAEA